MAETWAAAQAAPKVPIRLIVAGVVGLAAFAGSTWFWHLGHAVTAPSLAPPSLDAILAQVSGQPQRDIWLKDVLAARSEPPQSWDPAGPAATFQMPRAQEPREQRPAAVRSRPKSPANPAQHSERAPPASQADDFYGAIFGSAQRYRAASAKASSQGPATAPASAKASSVEGIVLRARLQDEVSSDPTGAPVIAVLARRADAGDVRLAPGTELHGRVVGSNETRIFVTFDFARTPGGERISLQGTARDEGGRVGIPGKKMFTQRTAGSIGVASASKVIQEAGRELAGPIGSVLGAGLEGAADAGADKTKRADRDEYVLIAQRGAGFAVYLQSSGS